MYVSIYIGTLSVEILIAIKRIFVICAHYAIIFVLARPTINFTSIAMNSERSFEWNFNYLFISGGSRFCQKNQRSFSY